MLARPEDLLALVGKVHEFEELLYDLVVAEASRHGLRPSDVDWDPRTTLADGGRDIVITQSHTNSTARFIPQRPSIWSAKSGKNGIDPDQLSKELSLKKHPKVRKHLGKGKPFVWYALH